jgi:hypothetical protein
MNTLSISIVAVVLGATIVALLHPGNTAGVVLAFGSPFVLFANVMACETASEPDDFAQARAALLVDWV